MRIQVGNRVVQSTYLQMGVVASEKKETADKESMSLLNALLKEH